MKLKAVSGITLTLLLIGMLALAFNIQPVRAVATTTLRFRFTDVNAYDQLTVVEDPAGDFREPLKSFTVLWIVEDVSDLFTWSCSLSWNPSILTCTKATYGPTFKSVDPAAMQMPFTITAGKIGTAGENLTTGEVTKTVWPDAAILFNVTFQVVGYGWTYLRWANTSLLDSGLAEIPRTEINGFFDNREPEGPDTWPPTAFFTYIPSTPGPQRYTGVWIFNASASACGFDGFNVCPITEYRWDWENDGVIDNVTSSPIITHRFTSAGGYNVSLVVYAPPSQEYLYTPAPFSYCPYSSPMIVWIGVLTSPSVGGISVPVNKFALLAPYIGLTILLAVAVITVGYVKKRKRNTEIVS